jgi:hypothetical protein
MEFTREELIMLSEALNEGEVHLLDKVECYPGDYTPEELTEIKRKMREFSRLQYAIDTQLYTKGNTQ